MSYPFSFYKKSGRKRFTPAGLVDPCRIRRSDFLEDSKECAQQTKDQQTDDQLCGAVTLLDSPHHEQHQSQAQDARIDGIKQFGDHDGGLADVQRPVQGKPTVVAVMAPTIIRPRMDAQRVATLIRPLLKTVSMKLVPSV